MAFNDRFDISAGSASAILLVEELYPGGIVLEHFGTDSGVVTEQNDIAETRMSVDGILVAGVINTPTSVTITLEAPSAAAQALMNLASYKVKNQREYICTLIWRVPALQTTFTYNRGALRTGTRVPAQNATLAPTTWTFDFQSVNATPF